MNKETLCMVVSSVVLTAIVMFLYERRQRKEQERSDAIVRWNCRMFGKSHPLTIASHSMPPKKEYRDNATRLLGWEWEIPQEMLDKEQE